MYYGLIVSNKDWRTKPIWKAVRASLLMNGHRVEVKNPARGATKFRSEVSMVIDADNIAEYDPTQPAEPVTAVESQPEAVPDLTPAIEPSEPTISGEPMVNAPDVLLCSAEGPREFGITDPPAQDAAAEPETNTQPPASQAALVLAAEHDINIADVPYKGAKVTRPNVQAFIEAQNARGSD